MTTNVSIKKQKHLKRKAEDLTSIQWLQRKKDIYDKFSSAWKVSKYIKALPSLVSILLAFLFVQYHLATFTGSVIISGLVAGVVLLLLEVGKGFLLSVGGATYYRGEGAGLLLVGAVFIFFSVGSSVGGAVLWLEENNESHALRSQHKEELQILSGSYKVEMNKSFEVLNNMEELRKSRTGSWLNTSERSTIKHHEERIQELEDKKEKEVQALQEVHGKQMTRTASSVRVAVVVVGCLSLFIELLIIGLNLFVQWFEVRTSEEAEGYSIQLPNGSNLNEVRTMFENFVLSNSTNLNGLISANHEPETQATPRSKKNIGFALGSNVQEEDYLNKHKEVVSCIQAGLPEAETLTRANIGRTTYYNIKRMLRTF